MKVRVICETCGCEFEKHRWEVREHNFCTRDCFRKFASKRMTEMNRQLNPERMTDQTRAKLRKAHLNTGDGSTYTKNFGRHEHRVVAEQMLGRKLKPGEVVHHIDGDVRNNSPDNLMVFASQSDHASYHAWMNKFFAPQGGDQI